MKIITIDGPASSGKGTIAKLVAQKLGFNYLDSGAIYRALAHYLVIKQINFEDTDLIIHEIQQNFRLEFIGDQVVLNKIDITHNIRSEEVGILASNIAKNPQIRLSLLNYQRSVAQTKHGLVTDGRDMGSVVFPNADLKIFLYASDEIRAKRRYTQLVELNKIHGRIMLQKHEDILKDIILRDNQDRNRSVAPLCYDSSFVKIDNSSLSVDETVEQIVKLFLKS